MIRTAAGGIAIEAAGLRNIHFAADDGFDAGLLRGFIEANCAEQISMIGDGDCRHFVFRSGLRQRVVIARAVEKAESGMKMQMDKVRHRFSETYDILLAYSHSIVAGGLEVMS